VDVSHVDQEKWIRYDFTTNNSRKFLYTIGLATSGTLVTPSAQQIPYTISLGNVAGRNMQDFTGTNSTMRGSDGKFFSDFQAFFDYYGVIDYADRFILAVIDGTKTAFANGNGDFIGKPFIGRNRKDINISLLPFINF
jgi:hypothetical protein